MPVKRTVTKRARSNVARINIPALNTVRREYLLGLARKYEDEVEQLNSLLGDMRSGRDFTQWTLRRTQCLKIAAIYREMADFAFSGDDPEALSEKERGRVDGEFFRAHARCTAAAPFDRKAGGHDEFVHRVLVEPVLQRRVDILESAGAVSVRSTRRIEMRPGRGNRNRQGLGEAFGVLS